MQGLCKYLIDPVFCLKFDYIDNNEMKVIFINHLHELKSEMYNIGG